jgi:hypothetical protein
MRHDYRGICGETICDGGVLCKQDNKPKVSCCKRCMCFNCMRQKCQEVIK